MKVLKTQEQQFQLMGLPVRRQGAIIIAIPVACLIASILAIAWLRDNTLQLRNQKEKSDEIIEKTNYIYKILGDAESAIRGYSLTKSNEFVEPYLKAKTILPQELKQLKKQLLTNSSQMPIFQSFEVNVQQKLKLLDNSFNTVNRQLATLNQTQNLNRQFIEGRNKMDALEDIVSSLIARENQKQQQLNNQINLWVNWTNIAQVFTLIFGSLGGVTSWYLFDRLQNQLEARESSLEQSKVHIQSVVDNAADAIITLDEQGQIKSFNLAAEVIFGYKNIEIIGQNFRQLLGETATYETTSDPLSFFIVNNTAKISCCRRDSIGRHKNNSRFFMDLAISEMRVPDQHLFIAICRDITEQRKADETLRNQAQLLDLANDSILVCDFNDIVNYWNQGSRRLYGWRKKETIGQNIHTLLQTEFPQPLEEIKKIILQEGYWEGELNQIKQDGIKVTIATRWTLQRDEEGEPIAILQINNDITEQKKIQNALRDSQQMLQLVINNIPQYIFWKDCNSVYLGSNQNIAVMSGLNSYTEIVGKTDYDLQIDPEKAKYYQEEDQWIIQTNTPIYHKIEKIYVPTNGKEIWIDINKIPLTNARGEVVGILCTFDDITERLQAAATLAESEQLFRATFEQAAVGMAQASFDGKLLLVNQKLCDLLGQTSEQLHHIHFQEITHPDDLAEELKYLDQLLAGEINSYTIEKRFLKPNGEIVWANLMVSVLEHSNGYQSLFGVVEDIRERKQTQEALLARADELAKMTKILAQTTTNLKKRNQELDQFAYVVSHDLKAPLRAIANLSSWIEEDLHDVLTEDTQHQMNLLRGRVHRMEALINGLLEYSRVGRINTSVEMVNVGKLLMDIIDSLAPASSYQVEVETPMPNFKTQRLPLEQVFSNLISNAIKHNRKKAGYVKISVADQGEFYQFSVADDGPGIAPEYHEKIFVIFSTLEARDKVENTGIGLSLVKKIVETQGGTITLESQEGQGSIFRFSWPKKIIIHS
ncbi:MAG TPA: PAS domain S-box protein [Halomicronema sp.]